MWDSKFKPALEAQRKNRVHSVNVEELRAKGTALIDETVIPDRTIDQNTRQSTMRTLRYLTEAENFVHFIDPVTPSTDFTQRQRLVTNGLRFFGWRAEFHSFLDCLSLTGRAVMEVVYDGAKPLNAGYRYVEAMDFIIPDTCRRLQDAPMVIQQFQLSHIRLRELSKQYSFSEEILRKLCYDDTGRPKSTAEDVCVDRCFYKVITANGVEVHDFWLAHDHPTDFLRGPQPLDIGLVRFPAGTQFPDEPFAADALSPGLSPSWAIDSKAVKRVPSRYPFVMAQRRWTEDTRLLYSEGVAEQDKGIQEALTSVYSAAVNTTVRASRFYPSLKPTQGQDMPSVESVVIKHGSITPFPLETFQPAPPSGTIISIAQAIASRNLQQSGQTDFAAMNRPDTEKTYREIAAAKSQADDLAMQDIAPFSDAVLEICIMCWEIIRDQSLLGYVSLLETPASLMRPVILEPAGDKEFLRLARMRQRMLEFWPIASATPLAQPFLEDLVRIMFPEKAAEWLAAAQFEQQRAAAMQQIQQVQAAVADFMTNIQTVQINAVPDNARAAIINLIERVAPMAMSPSDQAPAGRAGQGAGPAAPAQ